MNTRSPLLARVPVAWPTLVLLLAVCAGHLVSSVMALRHAWLLPLAMAINAFAAFAAFTVMHDASHRSVARSKLLNEVCGRIASVWLLAPFPALRFLHLEHHKHTNDPARDPDYWSACGARWLLPLRWLTQDLHYYARYFRVIRRRPRAEAIETVVSLLLFVSAVGGLIAAGHAYEVLLLWVVPGRLAIALLAFAFDYLPHRPHQVRAKDDRFAATAILIDSWLTPLFLCQNYHLIHHLYPAVPFYRYPAVWREQRSELLAQGARVVRLSERLRQEGPAPSNAASSARTNDGASSIGALSPLA